MQKAVRRGQAAEIDVKAKASGQPSPGSDSTGARSVRRRHTFVEKDAHEGSILGDRKKTFPGLSEQLMHLRFRDSRKIREKVRDGMTAIQVIEQRLDGYAGPDKARRPAHDLGVNGDDAGSHADKLAGGPFLARIDSRRRPSDFVDGRTPDWPWQDAAHATFSRESRSLRCYAVSTVRVFAW